MNPKLQIQDYQIHLPPLGEGTFGTVYRATYRGISERALKVFKEEAVDLPAMARELEKLSSVAEHHGIVTLHDFDLLSSTPYYAMGLHADERRDGSWQSRSLNDLCGRVDAREAARLMDEIADALAYLHRHQIVHCDLKPTNVLLTDESPPQIKICDFGQSRGANAGTGDTLGTPLYASPEQLTHPAEAGDGIGFQWDVYSFGVLAYKLITGNLPRLQELVDGGGATDLDATITDDSALTTPLAESGAPTSAAHIAKLLFEEEEVPWPANARIDPRRKALLTRCLALDRSQRPADMREVRNEIIRSNQERRAIRSRNMALLFGAVSAVAVIATGWAMVEAQRAQEAIESEQSARRDAEELVNFILFDLREKLRPLGRLELLEHIAENADTYFSSLSKDQRTVESLRSFATALEGRGAATFARGEYEEARGLYQKAFNIYDQLNANGQGDTGARFRTSQALANLGRCDSRLGEPGRAVEHLERALAMRSGEGEGGAPGVSAEYEMLSTGQIGAELAEIFAGLGEVDKARGALEAARATLTRLHGRGDGEAGKVEHLAALLRVIASLAELEVSQERETAAVALYEESVDLGRATVSSMGEHAVVMRLVADALHGLGTITLRQAGKKGSEMTAMNALTYFRQELIQRQALANRYPNDAGMVLELARCHMQVSACYDLENAASRTLAMTNLQRAINALESLRDPGDLALEREALIAAYRAKLATIYEMDE